jgi:pimeloyl-ACP methyl ester carboxylesterase
LRIFSTIDDALEGLGPPGWLWRSCDCARRHEMTELTHGMAEIEPGLRLHFVRAGDGERPIVLLHGFPQRWWQWRAVIPALVTAGFQVIAPDYRGAGDSRRPAGGYDKRTMAGDTRRLLREHLRIEPRSCWSATTSG